MSSKESEQQVPPPSPGVEVTTAPQQKDDHMEEIKAMLEQMEYITQESENVFVIAKGHVPGMHVDAKFYATPPLLRQLVTEANKSSGGFLSALQQLANVATLPGIVGYSLGMPDLHSGYGFAIGNVAAMDMSNPDAVVSPGGVGFDINCGVRLLRTNLTAQDIVNVQNVLADALARAIPVGVGSSGNHRLTIHELDDVLKYGMEWAQRKGFSWEEDLQVTEENGRFKNANSNDVSNRAKQRGKAQVGTLGSGNHYIEVQMVDEVYDEEAAATMGLHKGQACVMIHTGSRGMGHQVCSDALATCERTLAARNEHIVDRQLACTPIDSPDGRKYLSAMACAANFAFCNRALITHDTRRVFSEVFGRSDRELDMHVVYDVAHNIAKIEDHRINNRNMRVLVHRKGATRAFGPNHPCLPEKYRAMGQPVLIGGSMGTCSYVLIGTESAMENSFGSTCHGAGRCMSRNQAKRELKTRAIMNDLEQHGVALRAATPHLVAEEAPQSYKDVSEVVDCCHFAGVSKKCVKLKPIVVVKG